MSKKYTIDKARSRDDYDNMCFQPSDGGQYDAKTAITILENGNGGSICDVKTGGSFMVNYNISENSWLKTKLKI